MSAIKITLPDQRVLEFEQEPTVLDVAQKIGAGLAKGTLGAKINSQPEIIDFRSRLKDGTHLEIVSTKSPQANEVIRHSAAHIMAQAVQELWPDVKVTIGPVIENGFYYDFDSPRAFAPEDLEKIEKRMGEIVARDLPILREDWEIDKAIATFDKMGERFKKEIIEDLRAKGETKVGIYFQGDQWFDLCRGPHVQRTSQIKAFKILSLAGAYWRGDEKREQLQRIYATAFGDKKDLDAYLLQIEEAKKRDHRKIGKELGLFMFHPSSPGAPFFTGHGTVIYNELVKYIRELYYANDYQEVITPQIFNVDLYKRSGHYANYRENMYFTSVVEKGEDESSAKPMNCPSHCLMYANERHSYRELPIRLADFGRLHRFERSGVVHGLTRVRTFCQDDAHIFCRPEQTQHEIRAFMAMAEQVYQKLGMPKYNVFVATRPAARVGSDEVWDKAEAELQDGLKSIGMPYTISPGEGAFYGPKVEIHFVDAIGRSWQLGTIQVDFNFPEAFDLVFVGEDNSTHRPVMLHRAILGSLERFIGVYIEHCAGHFPLWLAPRQVTILNVTEAQKPYCQALFDELRSQGVRVEWDQRNEKLGYKIREAQLHKVPYMVIIGDQEMSSGTVSVRLRDGTNVAGLKKDEFITVIKKEIAERSLDRLLNAQSAGARPSDFKVNDTANMNVKTKEARN